MSTPWPLSAPVTALPLEFGAGVRRLAGLGFTHVDVEALADRPAEHLDALADSGVVVACAALGRGLPEGHTLGAPDVGVRRAALRLLERQVADAARLGATCACLPAGPWPDESARVAFTEGCALLAGYAAGRMVRLAVEPAPGGAGQALAWLGRVAHPNLGLLLDAGGCVQGGEDPAGVARRAGARLFHVRGDDRHLTRGQLVGLAEALGGVGYRGCWVGGGEPGGPDPEGALRHALQALAGLVGGG